jgi:hypothetical protein
MQLKNLRHTLATAAAGLLATSVARADDPNQTTVDSGVLFYRESGRVQAIEPVLDVTVPINEDQRLSFGVVADSLTGATPLGAVPSSTTQTYVRPIGVVAVGTSAHTVSSPSGGRVVVSEPTSPTATTQVVGASTDVPPNTYPLDHGFNDKRYGGHIGFEQALSDTLKLDVGGAYSREHDYQSSSGNLGLVQDFNAHNTTLNFGVNYEIDRSFPLGGTPTPLTVMSADWKGPDASRHEVDGLVSITQVMSRRWLASLSYSFGSSTGYQTDPYRIISVVDAITGEPTSQLYESRPDSRRKQSLFFENKVHLPEGVLELSARAYKDDWGVRSTTLDTSYHFNVFDHYYLEPHVRYYRQGAANFFRNYLVEGEALPQFASSDTRLGEFHAWTYGLTFGVPLDNGSEFNVRFEQYSQNGNQHPADAIGQLQQQDLFPTLKGMTVLLGYKIAF